MFDLSVGNPVCEWIHLWRQIYDAMSAWVVGSNVDDEDCGGRRSDVCRISAMKSDGDGSEIFERIVVEAVEDLKVVEDD